MASRCAIPLVVLCSLLLASPVRADTATDLQSAQAKLDALLTKMQAEQQSVDALQGQAAALARRIGAVETELAVAERRAGTLRNEVISAQRRLDVAQQRLDDRARAAYEQTPGTSIELILGATSYQNFNERLRFVDSVAQSDEDLIVSVESTRNDLQEKQAEAVHVEEQLQADQRALLSQRDTLQKELTAAQKTLQALSADRAAAETLVTKLTDQRAREIAAARLAAQRAASSSGTGSGGGSLSGSNPLQICPVDPPRTFYDDFGVPRPGGWTHQGNDIYAALGTPIRAPFPGSAVDATNDIGGQAVKVYGSQGYVYNAHLSKFGTLGSVSTGTIIGYVGNTGDAIGGPYHDHFEWHPGGGDAIDPYPFFRDAC
jgi:peptidoglycan hydrolase CwlO-like protein